MTTPKQRARKTRPPSLYRGDHHPALISAVAAAETLDALAAMANDKRRKLSPIVVAALENTTGRLLQDPLARKVFDALMKRRRETRPAPGKK